MHARPHGQVYVHAFQSACGCVHQDQVRAAGPPPLAILTGGFLVSAAAYASYAQRLASWGWTAILYDKVESTLDVVDDLLSVDMISDLMDHVAADPVLRRIASSETTFLCGHSRVRLVALDSGLTKQATPECVWLPLTAASPSRPLQSASGCP